MIWRDIDAGGVKTPRAAHQRARKRLFPLRRSVAGNRSCCFSVVLVLERLGETGRRHQKSMSAMNGGLPFCGGALPVRKSDAANGEELIPPWPIGAGRIAERRAGKPSRFLPSGPDIPAPCVVQHKRTSGCQACRWYRSTIASAGQGADRLCSPTSSGSSGVERSGVAGDERKPLFLLLLFSSLSLVRFCPHRFRTDCGHLSFASCVSLAFLVLCPALCRLPVMLSKILGISMVSAPSR